MPPIITVVFVIAAARLSFDSYYKGSLGFREIEHGEKMAAVASVIALLLFGPLDAVGVMAVFCYEIYNKVKEIINNRKTTT